ncbi:MAG TPA: hypothetical protein VMQ81_13710 [Acidimicrobiia bacterium]|nr:hypothetical protein [Acidimicrobiia bacterium]
MSGWRPFLAVLGLVAIVAVGTGCIRTAPDAPNATERLLELVNHSRAEHGLAPVACADR